MSEPNGSSTAVDDDERCIDEPPSDYVIGITLAAPNSHGEKMIFF